MRPLGTRRAGLVAGAATVAVLALTGCSAGQVAETAILDTPIAGVDSQTASGSVYIRNLQVEYPGVKGYPAGGNAPLELSLYNQTNSEITVSISSRPTEQAEVVSASQVGLVSGGPRNTSPGEPSASSDAGHASPDAGHASASAGHASASAGHASEEEPSAPVSEAPSAPASEAPSAASSGAPSAPASAAASAAPVQVKPAQIKLGAQGSALFRPSDAAQLQVIGLSDALPTGTSVNLVLEFSDGSPALELQAPVANPLTPGPREPGGHIEEAEGH
ncbi:hypothetical protein [Actinoplanes sp. DH11]|uniref:hypothetical protein n=1 Tax=Actinoplanes sp. DH11 TaxID=2857011 RepID=UPI001E43F916|nr:hypothetical protein [Actinoplanes sp. DH11]